MSESEVQGEVRRRDRFQCQNCGEKGQQYAHIIPEVDGGRYILENLLFLCYECHNYWQEPSRAAPEIRARLIKLSEELRDKPKRDSLFSAIFSWAAGQTVAVCFGGGFRVTDQERILERRGDESRPYLTLGLDQLGRFHINAYFDDAEGNDFMHVVDNELQFNTSDTWDVIFTRRSIKFEHSDRKMRLQIRQAENLDLYITGDLFLNGGLYEITDEYLLDTECNNKWEHCNAAFNGKGLLLSPGNFIL
jgi:hypothetical protein